MATQKWLKTAHRGLRYREHETRRHGKKRDRYYAIHFKVDKKVYDYGIGWWSDGIPDEARQHSPNMGFEEYCLSQLRLFYANVKSGSGIRSPKEKRQAAEDKRIEEQKTRDEEDRVNRTYGDYVSKVYFPWAEANKKPNSLRSEKMLDRLWIGPIIASIPMGQIADTQLEKLKHTMAEKGKAPKTVDLALALVRQVYNHAKGKGDFLGDNPVSRIKKPRIDNAKLRYLSPQEIDKLLKALSEKSQTVHDQALLAINSGLRFSEVAGLTWQDVNFKTRSLSIRDAKTGSRTVFMNEMVESMLKRRQEERDELKKKRGKASPLVFRDANEEKQNAVSKSFQRVADELFNQGVNDRRLRVSFHTLRHSFGSLVYQQTGDIYLTGKALGHRTLVMAARYAKMSEQKLRDAFETMGLLVESGKEGQGNIIELKSK